MPSLFTHLNFIDEEISNNPNVRKLDSSCLKFGSIIPDIDYFVHKKKIKIFHFMHYNYDLGITFAKDLLREAKTREEVSFAIGFLSHVILDKEVHSYLETTVDTSEHLHLEYIIDSRYAYERFPKASFPKDLFKRTITKKYNNYIQDINHINFLHIQEYRLAFLFYKSMIISNFIKARAKWYHNLLSIVPENKKFQKIKLKTRLKARIDKDKVKIVEERIAKAKEIFEKEVVTHFKRKDAYDIFLE